MTLCEAVLQPGPAKLFKVKKESLFFYPNPSFWQQAELKYDWSSEQQDLNLCSEVMLCWHIHLLNLKSYTFHLCSIRCMSVGFFSSSLPSSIVTTVLFKNCNKIGIYFKLHES